MAIFKFANCDSHYQRAIIHESPSDHPMIIPIKYQVSSSIFPYQTMGNFYKISSLIWFYRIIWDNFPRIIPDQTMSVVTSLGLIPSQEPGPGAYYDGLEEKLQGEGSTRSSKWSTARWQKTSSMGWQKRENLTRKPQIFPWRLWDFPVIFPVNQSIDI